MQILSLDKALFLFTFAGLFTALQRCSPDDSAGELEWASTEGLATFYEELQEHAQSFGYKDGQWTEDFGDAAAFGPAFYANAGLQTDRQDYLDKAAEAAAYDLDILTTGGSDLIWLGSNLEAAFMATQGLISWADSIPTPQKRR